MVKGIQLFQEHFREHKDKYVLIGGAACDLAMEAAGLQFRSTRDLDIVLRIEGLDKTFFTALWDFIRAGKYQNLQQSSGHRQFYRFKSPETDGYPVMLELFSRKPDGLILPESCHLTPIPAEEDISSLSAILLDDDYYAFLHAGKKQIENVPIVGPEHLIPLKARAWLDLKKRKDLGDKVDSTDIKKHQKDIFRLFQIIDPEKAPAVPTAIQNDMKTFILAMKNEEIDLERLGYRESKLEDILNEIRRIYCRT